MSDQQPDPILSKHGDVFSIPKDISDEARESILDKLRPTLVKPSNSQVDHFGVLETVYYRSPNMSPIGFETKYTRIVETDEQPYDRIIKTIKDDRWTRLNTGWLEDNVSQLVIQNTCSEGPKILVGVSSDDGLSIVPFTIIPPKESIRIIFLEGTVYYLMSIEGTAGARIFAVPK